MARTHGAGFIDFMCRGPDGNMVVASNKYSKFKIQRPFIPTKNQNQKMILCHVKVI